MDTADKKTVDKKTVDTKTGKEPHGGNIYNCPISYDFSANINPLGMPEGARKALEQCGPASQHYPDPDCTALREAVSKVEKVQADAILCGNGAVDLIFKLVQVLQPKTALLPVPSFSEYEKALTQAKTRIRHYLLRPENGFALGPDFGEQCKQVDMVFLCLPNNPTGALLSREQLTRIRTCCRESGTVLVMDACFLDFALEDVPAWIGPLQEKEVLLRAFTKNYGMPGLRLGYLISANPSYVKAMREWGPCWNVSVPATLAGMAALQEEGYLNRTRSLIQKERAYLQEQLEQLGLTVYPSQANFLLWKGREGLSEILRREGVAIRDCSNFVGLGPGYYRTAVRTHEENTVLIECLRGAMEQADVTGQRDKEAGKENHNG